MISCRRAAELTSLQLDADLPAGQRLVLGFHRIVCAACRRFRSQLVEIDRATGEFLRSEPPAEGPELPDDARARIHSQIDSATRN